MKKTVIAVCVFGLAAVAAQAQGVARDFNEFGKMYGNNSAQGKRITGTLEKANRQAAREHAREQQSRQHADAPAASAAGNNQSGAQAAPAQPKAKAKSAGKKGNAQGNASGKPAAPAKPKAKQPVKEKEKGFWDLVIESIASQNHVSTAAFK